MQAVDRDDFVQRYVNRAEARARYGPRVDRYARFYEVGDPLADAVVEAFEAMGRDDAQAMLMRALDHGIDTVPDAPEALRALVAQVDAVPVWADFDRMDRGARAYQRTGTASALVLSAFSLMNGYRCGAAVKPLVFTRQLEQMAPRRLAETGRFIVETIQEGAMRRTGEGFKLAVRVRVMHAMVRRMLLRTEWWDREAWGVPINQADMAGTILEFSMLMIHGTRMLGFRFSREESEAILHLWRYSGWLGGVDPSRVHDRRGGEPPGRGLRRARQGAPQGPVLPRPLGDREADRAVHRALPRRAHLGVQRRARRRRPGHPEPRVAVRDLPDARGRELHGTRAAVAARRDAARDVPREPRLPERHRHAARRLRAHVPPGREGRPRRAPPAVREGRRDGVARCDRRALRLARRPKRR